MSKTTQFFILTVQNNSLEKNLMVLFLIWSIIRLSLNPFCLFLSFRLFRSFHFVEYNKPFPLFSFLAIMTPGCAHVFCPHGRMESP